MIPHSFLPTIRLLKTSRKYILYSALYGLTTLIVPLAVQFLVNNLALSGLWLNIVGFIIIIGIGLTISLLLKYCQVILNEYLQRELFFYETKRWKKNIPEAKRMYFVEIFFGLKSYSKSFTTFVDIVLTTAFGLLMIVTFHPAFLILPLIIGVTLYQIHLSTMPAVQTSIHESDEKYHLYQMAFSDESHENEDINAYLSARNDHFNFIRMNTIKISILFVLCQIALLGGGTWMVQSEQLSIGQLVSAEIIFSGIMVSLNKLPSALEGFYDYETSIYKLMKAKGEVHE
jgi:ABC-type bacteriocin/lantibiotic exporter with double-glycine peptidase domain